MKRKLFQRIVCLILAFNVILGCFAITSSAGEYKGSESTSSTLEEMKNLIGTDSYRDYFESAFDIFNSDGKAVEKQNKLKNPIEISVTDLDFSRGDAIITSLLNPDNWGEDNKNKPPVDVDRYGDYAPYWNTFDDALYGDNTIYLTTINAENKASTVTWTFEVSSENEGFYNLYIEYYNCNTDESSVSAIQRKLMIDGKVPFSEVGSITFDKEWTYKSETDKSADRYYKESVSVISKAEYDQKKKNNATYSVTYNWDDDGYYKVVSDYVVEGEGASAIYKKVVRTYTITSDINGNSMAPLAKESSRWNTYICRDKSGYSNGYFSFYLTEGTHTITLEAEREPMVIRDIRFEPVSGSSLEGEADSSTSGVRFDGEKYYFSESNSFAQFKAALANDGKYNAGKGSIITLQAEFPDAISDSSVAASNDNTSAATTPVSAGAQMFNVIGETGYDAIGQWAAYTFKVTESGMYKISMRFMQDALQGMFICRSIKIAGGNKYVYGVDGSPVAPYEEATRARFNYNSDWQSEYIGYYDGNGIRRELEFYFEEGEEYTLYLECALGDLKSYIQQVEMTLANLNDAYLQILQYTGSDPDENQNYKFHEKLPEVLITLLDEAENLTRIADDLEKLCGTNGSHIATLDTVARILLLMGKDHGREIAANLSSLKTYLGTLGTWINDSKMGTMKLDSISITPSAKAKEENLPDADANFFEALWFEIKSFIYSFFTNYEWMGLKEEPKEDDSAVDVWIAMGRDQSNIWRSMIDSEGGFTDKYGKAVALKLVTGGTLLPSILSGKGPDVYLGLGSADVINYAIRNAVLGVSGNDPRLSDQQNAVFSDFETVVKGKNTAADATSDDNFSAAAMKTLTIYSPYNDAKVDGDTVKSVHPDNPDVTYGIPMTMGFSMMFYRMDVLAQLEQEVPETWDQLLEILPVFQANNMEIGVAYISALDFMMYQMGGSMWKYTDDSIYASKYAGAKIDLDSDIALEAFEFVCRLYTDYSFPVAYDTANRFRTGEMPIVIGDYASIYNTLVVYATDIGGLWEFSSLPGSFEKNVYRSEDGQILYKSELLAPADAKAQGLTLISEGKYNYDSLAGVAATIILKGCEKDINQLRSAWDFVKWQTSAKVQATYGNRIVSLIGPAAKYETANLLAIDDLSWTAREKAAIKNQMAHLNAIVNYPGSYIYSRYMKFAFLDAYNDGAEPHDAMMSYIDAINKEITRKREEFGLEVLGKNEEPPLKPVK